MNRTAITATDGLDDRKAEILKTVIDIYLEEPTPVASKMVGIKSRLGVSSATIRNEMHALEEEGYLSQTHTSSGRIPTDRGYRFFVDNFVANQFFDAKQTGKLTIKGNESIDNFVPTSAPNVLDEMVVLLSTLTQHTAVAVRDCTKNSVIADVHVSVLNANRLVIGLFFEDATIDRVVINFDQFSSSVQSEIEKLTTEVYGQTSQRLLKALIVGKQISEIGKLHSSRHSDGAFEKELLDLVVLGCKSQSSDAEANSVVHVAGVSKIANVRNSSDPEQGEFSTKVLSLVEQHMKLVDVIRNGLSETIDARIGSENNLEELKRHSMILAPIKGSDGEAGALGIIGPTRMDYLKAFDCINAASQVASKYMDG